MKRNEHVFNSIKTNMFAAEQNPTIIFQIKQNKIEPPPHKYGSWLVLSYGISTFPGYLIQNLVSIYLSM